MKNHKISATFIFILCALFQLNAQMKTHLQKTVVGDLDDPSGVATGPRKVVWVHGLEGSSLSWQQYANLFQGQRSFQSVIVEYANKNVPGRYANQIADAKDIIIPQLTQAGVTQSTNSNNIFIGHSMGGLVTRDMDRQLTTSGQNPYFGGFVTFATPNSGAPLAKAVEDGRIDNFMEDGVRNLLAGPAVTFSGVIQLAGFFGYDISVDAAVRECKNAVLKKFDFATGPMHDLPPTSQFFNTLNSFSSNKKMIAVAAKEDAPSMWREISSLIPGQSPTDFSLNQTDDGKVKKYVDKAIKVYQGIEDYYWWRKTLAIFKDNRRHYSACEVGYRRGWQWLDNAPKIWNLLVSGGTSELNDGIVPETSAKGLSGAYVSEVLGVNHQECMNHPAITQKLTDIFNGVVGTLSERDFFRTQ